MLSGSELRSSQTKKQICDFTLRRSSTKASVHRGICPAGLVQPRGSSCSLERHWADERIGLQALIGSPAERDLNPTKIRLSEINRLGPKGCRRESAALEKNALQRTKR